MAEIKSEVKTFQIDMVCDKCGQGYMLPVGNMVLATYPIQYPHQCTNCGNVENYIIKYPYIVEEKL